jgi:hypothetical protein
MCSKVDDYVYAYALSHLKSPALPDNFVLEYEMKAVLETNLTSTISKVNGERLIDPSQLAERVFDDLLTVGAFEIVEGDVVGPYFKLPAVKYNTYRSAVCSQNEIIKRSRVIGGRYFPEALAAFEQQLTDGNLAAFTPPAGDDATARISDSAEAEVVPAADRRVSLAHNQPEYEEIAESLQAAIEEVSALKTNEISNDEKASALASLRSAAELWRAYELKVIHIKIGIVMAIEEAERLTQITFKLVRGPLLVEAIKFFIRQATGTDF